MGAGCFGVTLVSVKARYIFCLELDPQVFDQRLEAAKKAIEDRLLELICHDSTDPGELTQLADAQRTVSFLQKTEQKNMR